MEGVLSIFPSETLQLHTTRSWDFMGFPESTASEPSLESDIIIGVIDSGIWTRSKSFSDEGLGPVPQKWKGSCQGGPKFKCNRKIIGARFYNYLVSARDEIGHGTHTASIAAGKKVTGASFNETLAKGTARGGAPSSRIAAYKVCTIGGCPTANILAAFDDAIADGVDYRLEQAALTGVSIGKVVLGDGKILTGRSINIHSLGNKPKFPLVYANNLNSSSCNENQIRACLYHCVDKDYVAGKIVMCKTRRFMEYVRGMGAAGMIYLSYADYPLMQPFPAVAHKLEAYANTKEPRATIPVSGEGKDTLAPVVVSWSSRAPGVGILAAFPPKVLPSGNERSVNEDNIMSGTSMSCPHAAGALAYIKSLHPNWSPAALKSAFMTTAAKDLNYPSMTAMVNVSEPINISFTRIVTNVGHPNSTYKATITADPNLTIKVVPDTLTFAELNEKKSYQVQKSDGFSGIPRDVPFDKENLWSNFSLYLFSVHVPMSFGGLSTVAYVMNLTYLDPQMEALLQLTIQTLELIIVLSLLDYATKPESEALSFLKLSSPRKWWLASSVGFVILILLIFLTSVVEDVLFGPKLQAANKAILKEILQSSDITKTACFLAYCVIIPLLEEIVYRGYLLSTLASKTKWQYAVLMSSLVFSAAHFSIDDAFQLFVIGCILGCSYCWTGRIKALTNLGLIGSGPSNTFAIEPTMEDFLDAMHAQLDDRLLHKEVDLGESSQSKYKI
ncbi:unnamed protein product [Rhodiola kirilowii]